MQHSPSFLIVCWQKPVLLNDFFLSGNEPTEKKGEKQRRGKEKKVEMEEKGKIISLVVKRWEQKKN